MDVSWIFWCYFWLFDEFFACSGASSTQPWAKCPVRRYVAPARNSSLQEPIHQSWIQGENLKNSSAFGPFL